MADTNGEGQGRVGTPTAPDKSQEWYVLECDGGSRGNPGPAAIGVVLRFPDGGVIQRRRYLGAKTSNEAEYEALICGLWIAHKNGARKVIILMDSKLIVEQVNGNYEVKAPHLQPLWAMVQRRLTAWFDAYVLSHIPREQNGEADFLVNKSLDRVLGKKRQGEAA
jgi:ribonuclease HI